MKIHIMTLALLWSLALAPALAEEVRLPSHVERVNSIEGIDEYRLANGLQVLLAPDDSKPTTTVNVTYHVGSRQESYGETGMAHLLEHLIFKGTPKHRNVWAEFAQRGLRANGSTWLDRTNYFGSFSSSDENLKWFLEWQADAMVNSFIAKRDLDTEMMVVRNEMEMGENNPGRILLEKGLASMFQWHNYGKSTIGARSDVENVDISRLQGFYKTYYQPDNATLIVAGRFNESKVLEWIAASFGRLTKPKRQLQKLYTIEPPQDGERSVTLRRNGGVPLLYAMYHLPAGSAPDFAAAQALSLIMTDAPSGRLHKRLVETQQAAMVFGFVQGLYDPGFGVFGAQLRPEQDIDRARDTLTATLETVGKEPISEEEVQRAKTKWLKNWDTAYANPETVGVALSEAIAQGDWRLFFLTRDRVRDLRAADVQNLANSYLLRDNRAVAAYIPTDQPARAPLTIHPDVAPMFKGYVGDPSAKIVESFDASPINIESRTQRFSLRAGLRAAVLPKGTRGHRVAARLDLKYGTLQSLQGRDVLGAVVASLLDKGTISRTRQQLQDDLDQLKADVDIRGADDRVSIFIKTTGENLPATIALVAQMLKEPAFLQESLKEVRTQTLAGIEEARKEPETLVDYEIERRFNPYPPGDVRHVEGFDEQIARLNAIQLNDVRDFHTRFYSASNAEFSAVGDFDVQAVKSMLESAFGTWRGGEPYERIPHPPVAVPADRVVVRTPDKQNAYMRVAQTVAVTDGDADYPAFLMANYLLGQGGNSRLWRRLRESEGLSYDVHSFVEWNPWEPNSMWTATAIFAPQNLEKVDTGVREELAKALKDGFTARELEEGRKGLLNFRRLSRAQDSNLTSVLVENLRLGRDFTVSQRVDDKIATLTLDEVNGALRKYLRVDQLVIGVGGNFRE